MKSNIQAKVQGQGQGQASKGKGNDWDRAWREGRRLRAWELYQLHPQDPKRWSQSRIAEALGVSRGAVSRWFKAAKQGGSQALLRHIAPGGVSRLSNEQLEQLAEWLQQEGGATAFGFVGQVWTRPRIAHLIESRFGVKYHPSQVGRILKKMGFSLQKPIRVAHQRDEEAVERWIKEEWPTLKKSG